MALVPGIESAGQGEYTGNETTYFLSFEATLLVLSVLLIVVASVGLRGRILALGSSGVLGSWSVELDAMRL